MEPKCTGKWGAFASNLPFQSKIPQEKSNLYLILVLIDIFCNTLPIYSAMDISLVEYKVSLIGSIFSYLSIRFEKMASLTLYFLICIILFFILAVHPYFKRIEEVEDNNKEGPTI